MKIPDGWYKAKGKIQSGDKLLVDGKWEDVPDVMVGLPILRNETCIRRYVRGKNPRRRA